MPDHRYRGTIVLYEPISSIAEAYRNARTSLFYSIPEGSAKVLALSSCVPRDGKTTTCVNLAITVAQSGKRVLLIDADLHRSMVAEVLGLSGKVGLTDLLVGKSTLRAAVQQVEGHEKGRVVNLDVLAAGTHTPNPAELLDSDKMRELLREVRGIYDWVFVDTPPLLFVSDASIMSVLCDGIILVVRSGVSNRSLLRRVKEQLEGVHGHIIGSILNDMTVSRVGRYYSSYYYHGYSRYSKDYHRSYYSDGKGQKKTDKGTPPAPSSRSKSLAIQLPTACALPLSRAASSK